MKVVWIEISDEVWELYNRSWGPHGVRTHAELVRMLEVGLEEESMQCIENAKQDLISYEPEALVLRAIGLMEEKTRKDEEANHS